VRAFVAVNSLPCSGETSSSGKTSKMPIASSLSAQLRAAWAHHTKSKKSRRVDMSRELRRALLEIRDKRLLNAFMKGKNDISEDLVFLSPGGAILDPDNLYHSYFRPVLTKSGFRKIRLHDLRHTFGSLLIQSGASIVYVKEQMGHSSIQVTVDT
jgi:integrase